MRPCQNTTDRPINNRHMKMSIAYYLQKEVVPSTEWYRQGGSHHVEPSKAPIYSAELEELEKAGYYPLERMLKEIIGDTKIRSRDNRYVQLFWKFKAHTKKYRYNSGTLERGEEVEILIDEMRFMGMMAKHNGGWFLKRVYDGND